MHHRQAHADQERPASTQERHERAEQLPQAHLPPVEHRTVCEVGEVLPLQQRHRHVAVQHEPGTDDLLTTEPPDRPACPVRFDPRPVRVLKERYRGLASEERFVIRRRDLVDS